MRFAFFCFLLISVQRFEVYAQPDTAASNHGDSGKLLNATVTNITLPDSAALAQSARQKFMEDSVAMFYLVPDPLREDQFISSILKNNLLTFYSQSPGPVKQKGMVRYGQLRNSRDPWVIAVVIGLLIYTALLNLLLNKDIKSVIQSFYNKHALSQVDKEGGLINPWAVIGLFLLFTLTLGLVLYQLSIYYHVYHSVNGFALFISLSLMVGLLFILKYIILKFIGVVFDASLLVKEYIAILNLTYFNMAFALLGVVICFSLIENQYIPWLNFFTGALIVAIFAWQYLRNSVSIISNIRFHKFYLFIYLCALEICPVLILIKALNI